jgi:hypothetical protein
MPFKSGKFWLRIYSRFLLAFIAAAVPTAALATITVVSQNFGSTSGSVAYYAILGGSYGSAFSDTGDPAFSFDLLNITATMLDENKENELLFDVTSDKGSTIQLQANQQLALMIMINPGGSNPNNVAGTLPVPIASINGSACRSDNPSNPCLAPGLIDSTYEDHYFAVPFSGEQKVRIGLYPKDICQDYTAQAENPPSNQTNATGAGCDLVTETVTPVNGNQATMSLMFELKIFDGVGATGPTGVARDSGGFSLGFQSDASTFNCPELGDSYFPGDGQINVNSSIFGLSTYSGRAKVTSMIVVGSESGDVTLDSTFESENSLVKRITLGGNQKVDGFANSNETETHNYTVGFMVKDAAGLVYPNSLCKITPVQTAAIEGFLQKSGCFIATAAFGDENARPVRLLREFRDRVLLRTVAGRGFVNWYYEWSPPAAEWLTQNPWVRIPVLIMLLPVLAVAWLLLHPLVVLGIFAGAAMVALEIRRATAMKREGA